MTFIFQEAAVLVCNIIRSITFVYFQFIDSKTQSYQSIPKFFNCYIVQIFFCYVDWLDSTIGGKSVTIGFFCFFVFCFCFAVPSSVPTSEVLLPRHSSRHPPPSATPRAHSASRPRPQRSTGGDVRSLVGCIRRKHCTAAESLRWCSVDIVPVLIEHTQDTTYCAPYWRQC